MLKYEATAERVEIRVDDENERLVATVTYDLDAGLTGRRWLYRPARGITRQSYATPFFSLEAAKYRALSDYLEAKEATG